MIDKKSRILYMILLHSKAMFFFLVCYFALEKHLTFHTVHVLGDELLCDEMHFTYFTRSLFSHNKVIGTRLV